MTSISLADIERIGADIAINTSGVASTSRGLVGDTIFAVLPNVKPIHTFVITILFQSVSDWQTSFDTGSFISITDLVNQALDFSDVQIIFDCADALWIHLFFIWLACP